MAPHDHDDSRAATWADAFARIPWWACIALAVASHVVLHALSLRPHLIVTDPAQLRSALASLALEGLLGQLQYLLPLLWLACLPLARCIAAADALAVPPPAPLSAREFELLLGDGLRIRHHGAAPGRAPC